MSGGRLIVDASSHQLKLNPSKIELMYITVNADPCQDLVNSLDNRSHPLSLHITVGILHEMNNDVIKPTDTFYQDDEHLIFTTKNSHFTRDVRFKLDEPFYEDTKDGRLCHSVISLKGGQLVQVQKWDGKETTIVREIKGSNMFMTLKFDGVEGVRIYEKV